MVHVAWEGRTPSGVRVKTCFCTSSDCHSSCVYRGSCAHPHHSPAAAPVMLDPRPTVSVPSRCSERLKRVRGHRGVGAAVGGRADAVAQPAAAPPPAPAGVGRHDPLLPGVDRPGGPRCLWARDIQVCIVMRTVRCGAVPSATLQVVVCCHDARLLDVTTHQSRF